MTFGVYLSSLAFAVLSAYLWRRQRVLRREAFIRSYVLPKGLFEKLMKKHPQLTIKDCQLVAHGLRQFFLAHLKSGRMYVSMPSQVADDLWHELILYTKNYQQFCQQAFGRFLHHTPAIVLSKGQRGNDGIRRCWRYVCKEENINPNAPTRLPLLFALDGKFNINEGFLYVPDCHGVRRSDDSGGVYCGADLGSGHSLSDGGSGCSSDSGSCGSGGSDGGGGGDSGGDSGCGGGGCGGGGD
ncbi:glycine-rich domain-containing protein [Pseudoduganella aquatica]|uniref:Uncharacterized protein n=1 Tax=Pseudoduganella aquatica TaxID=2660641 RepID=A0A7X4HDA1_9BURK|nr:hypothetical protein [Pseudoduganella aquatica]MYN08252.1 hypothetical protein [Pseudoduganella aquatica]